MSQGTDAAELLRERQSINSRRDEMQAKFAEIAESYAAVARFLRGRQTGGAPHEIAVTDFFIFLHTKGTRGTRGHSCKLQASHFDLSGLADNLEELQTGARRLVEIGNELRRQGIDLEAL